MDIMKFLIDVSVLLSSLENFNGLSVVNPKNAWGIKINNAKLKLKMSQSDVTNELTQETSNSGSVRNLGDRDILVRCSRGEEVERTQYG